MVDVYFLADGKNLRGCYCCQHSDNLKNAKFHSDSRSTLMRLCIMLADPVSSQLISRHILLINHYLGITNNTLKISDVELFMVVLEYLCRELDGELLYETPLISLLYIIQKPLEILVSSQSEQYRSDIRDYFGALANCYSSLTKHELKFMIITAINNLMFANKTDDKDYYITALEESEFAETFSNILAKTQDKRDLGNILDLFLQLTVLSDRFCVILYEEEYVERLLNLVPLFDDDEGQHVELYRTGSLLLRILAATVISGNYSPLIISQKAIRYLRYWFKKEVLSGQRRKRNLIMTIILAIIKLRNNLNFASSHLLEDLILIGLAPKWVKQETWAKEFEITSDPLDFEFIKLLLVALYEIFDYSPTKVVFEKLEGVTGLIQLFDMNVWTEVENNVLLMYTLHLVPRIAKCLHEEIIKYDVLSKMILRSGQLVGRSDCNDVFFYLIQSIYSLTLNNNLMEYFQEKTVVLSLIDYCETILKMTSWTLRVQQILQYTLNSTVCIASKLCGLQWLQTSSDNFTSELIKRYVNPTQSDSLFDPCLIISITDFIWTTQEKGERCEIEFLKSGGVYSIIDALEKEVVKKSSNGGTLVLLGFLSDLLQDDLAITQAVTWKGSHHCHLLNMLCEIWRNTEKEKKVKRNGDLIEDCEASLMGYEQGCVKYLNKISCPPLLEMIGCHRPKIYSIVSQLLKHKKNLVEITEDTYSALFRKLTTQDKVTMEIIKHYEFLKEGEIWQNMLYTIKRNKIIPLVGDELVLHTLITKSITCAKNIQLTQLDFIKEESNRELEEEKKLYENIRISKIVEEVDKYREIERNMIIQNSDMRKHIKQGQLNQIENASQIDWKRYGYIHTYNNKSNTTMLEIGRDIISTGKKNISS